MATPILDSVSKDLAYKLQDPVSTGTANGVRLTAVERHGYILRAYRRLLRIISMLYPNLIQKLFQSYYVPLTGTSSSAGIITIANGYAEVFDIYCKEPTDEEYFKATFISPDLFYDIEAERNSFYVPDLNTDRYFWTRIEDDVRLLPALTLSYKMIYRPDIIKQIEDDRIAWLAGTSIIDLDVPTEYRDLILALACKEGYLDIGQADLARAYHQDFTEEIGLLTMLKQTKEKNDDKDFV